MRFFFDYANKEKVLFDYRGDEFSSPHCAIEFAQATAEHLQCSLFREWLGWFVEVRNAEGRKFCSVPVDGEGMISGA